MKYQRTAIFGGLLVAILTVVVAGVAAQRDRQSRPDRREQVDSNRQLLRLSGRGSQLGVEVSDIDDASQAGVRIDRVEADSPAARGGVKTADVVVEFDGERVRSARQLTRLVQETPSGRTVKMTVLREGAQRTIDVAPESADRTVVFGPDVQAQLDRGLRDLPRLVQPRFDFRFEGIPGSGERGRLGIEVQTLSDQLSEYFGVQGGGVLVSTVAEDSPAEKADVKAGDVISAVNGIAVRDVAELVHELDRVKGGEEVSLGVVRNKKDLALKATIERPRATRARRSRRPL